ncbi:MAG: 30S ribosomal protein S20 [Cyanobacteria bacterium]|nr:30S ribosomal protein S20 [Cyanobacteriota bacterium]
MPRIKSAIKRVSVAERNRRRNMAFKSSVRTAIKKVFASLTDAQAADVALKNAYSLIDRGVLKGIVHKNAGARYKSRIARAINKAQTTAA